MGRNKNLKSGASLIVMFACMAVIASVFGYFISSWVLDYIAGPEESIVEEQVIEIEEENISDEFKVENDLEDQTSLDASRQSEELEEYGNDNNLDDTADEVIEPTESNELYTVQVGAFSTQENAEAQVDSLETNGFSGYITSQDPYRVQAGAFRTEEAALEFKEELIEAGFSVYINN